MQKRLIVFKFYIITMRLVKSTYYHYHGFIKKKTTTTMALASVMQEEHLGSTWFSFGAEVHVPLLTFLWSMRYIRLELCSIFSVSLCNVSLKLSTL
jgi:hypothetical protein